MSATAVLVGVVICAAGVASAQPSATPANDENEENVENVETTPPRPRLSIGAAAELGVGDDLSAWRSLRADGCAFVGRFCVGALVRYARDAHVLGDGADLATSRTTFDALATAELALGSGRIQVVPALGAGLSTLRSTRVGFFGSEGGWTRGLTVAGRTAADVGLRRNWSLRLSAELGYTSLSSTRFASDEEARPALAGMPRLVFRIGLGARYRGL